MVSRRVALSSVCPEFGVFRSGSEYCSRGLKCFFGVFAGTGPVKLRCRRRTVYRDDRTPKTGVCCGGRAEFQMIGGSFNQGGI
jgi:hypothetical protein